MQWARSRGEPVATLGAAPYTARPLPAPPRQPVNNSQQQLIVVPVRLPAITHAPPAPHLKIQHQEWGGAHVESSVRVWAASRSKGRVKEQVSGGGRGISHHLSSEWSCLPSFLTPLTADMEASSRVVILSAVRTPIGEWWNYVSFVYKVCLWMVLKWVAFPSVECQG